MRSSVLALLTMSTRTTPFAVRALYEYDVEQEDDLPFEPGQIINVTEICDDQWYFGYYEANGSRLEGMFPINYVEDAPHAGSVAVNSSENVNQPAHQASSPELPSVPQPQTRAAPIEDDWGSDASADEDQVSPKLAQELKKSTIEPTEKPVSKSDVGAGQAPLQAAVPPTTLQAGPDAQTTPQKSSLSKAPSQHQTRDDTQQAAANDQGSDREMPDITPGESLSSNFKSRRGIFDQKENEQDNTKPLTRTKTNPQKLHKWQPQQDESAPSRNTFSQKTDEEQAAPRVSIKERLAMIQQQEQEMQQREENEKRRREREDEQLRLEEARRIREQEETNATKETESPVEEQEEAPVGPIEGHAKPPSIPVLPRVSDTEVQEPKTAGSFDDDEEGARKIALRERMARISGLGNSGGISLGMMLGRNPNGTQSGGPSRTRRPKKKDVSAMSDLERELYLASVEYDQMHGAEDEEEDIIGESVEGTEENDIADDETLVGARDTDAETLAESDMEPDSHRQLPTATENPISVPVQAPVQASPSRVPSAPHKASVTSQATTQAPSIPTAPETPPEDSTGGETVHASALASAHAPVSPTTPKSAPPVPDTDQTTPRVAGAPPVPAKLPLPSGTLEDPTGMNLTDTTALAADEGSSSSSSDDEYSDASGPREVPVPQALAHPAAPINRANALRRHDLQARSQSDSETGYEADADTDDPSKLADADLSSASSTIPSLHSESKNSAPTVPPVPTSKRAPPQIPSVAPVQSQSRAPPSIPARQPVSPPPVPGQARPPPIPGQAPPVPTSTPRAVPPPPQAATSPIAPTRAQEPARQAPVVPPAPKAPQAPQSPPVPSHAPPTNPASKAPPQIQAPSGSSRGPASPSQKSPPAPPSHHHPAPPAPVDTSARTAPAPPAAAAPPEAPRGHRRKQPSSGGSEVDLDLGSLWFTKENGLPASIDPTKVAVEFEHQETNKRGRVIITHDVYVLYSDLSQLHIEVSHDKKEPEQARGTQKYIAPPKVDSTELGKSAKTIGAKIYAAASRHTEITHTSAFVKSLFKEVPEALPPIKGSFGLSIYENFGGASVHQIDSIYPGDIVVLVQAEFQSSKSALTSPLQKHHKSVTNSVYVVQEWDGSKKKLRVFDTKKESFRLGDLTSGMVKIYRPIAREIVGW